MNKKSHINIIYFLDTSYNIKGTFSYKKMESLKYRFQPEEPHVPYPI